MCIVGFGLHSDTKFISCCNPRTLLVTYCTLLVSVLGNDEALSSCGSVVFFPCSIISPSSSSRIAI